MGDQVALQYTLAPAHVCDIAPGDTVLHGGYLRTVSARNIGRDAFMGRTLFGDSYRSGTLLVQRAEIFHAKAATGGDHGR